MTLICLASTQSLHVRHEISVQCTRPVWDNSQTRLYNMAFEVNPKRVKSLVNVSYVIAFKNPKMLLPIDLRRIFVRKTACVSRRNFHEQIVISNIPFFGEALANVAASRDDTHPNALRVTAKFNVNTPCVGSSSLPRRGCWSTFGATWPGTRICRCKQHGANKMYKQPDSQLLSTNPRCVEDPAR